MKNIILIILIILIGYLIYHFILKKYINNKLSNKKLYKTINDINKINPNNILKIPRKIHQTIQNKNKIEPEFQNNINYIKNLNPNWTYNLYDDSDILLYIKEHYPHLEKYYLAINPNYGAAKSDFFRYLLMYREGGVYLDIKSAMKYKLDNLLYPDDTYILSHWGYVKPHEKILKKYGEFQQWHIICVPNHPFLKNVIDTVVSNIKNYELVTIGTGKLGVLQTTGPIPYTLSILPLLPKYKFRIAKAHSDIGLIYNNIDIEHTKIFGKTHYSNCKEPIILSNKDITLNPIYKNNYFEDYISDSKQDECSIVIDIVPNCKNVLEIGSGNEKISSLINKNLKDSTKHILVDIQSNTILPLDNTDKYTIINKKPEDLLESDLHLILPIDCVISHYNESLLKFLKTDIGKKILKSSRIFINKNNHEISNILLDYDFIHTNFCYSYGTEYNTNVYTKI